MKRLTVRVFGMVQGIGYRYTSQKEAKKSGFTGYARNGDDGSVEIVAEGSEADLKNFIQWCYNDIGPAVVKKVETSWSEPTSEFNDFTIKP